MSSILRTIYPDAKDIFLDANLLVLLIAGQVRVNLMQTLSPGNLHLVVDDFDLIKSLLADFDKTITTPYILSEVNTLFNKLDHNSRIQCREKLAEYIPKLENKYQEPTQLATDPLFSSFGIADISILHASEETLVVTEDGSLLGLLQKRRDVLDYSALKSMLSKSI